MPVDTDPRLIYNRLVAEGVIQEPPSVPQVVIPKVRARQGRSHPNPEDVHDVLVVAGVITAPVVLPEGSTAGMRVHPADLVEWAIVNWWPGYLADYGLTVDDPTDLEAGVAELARHLSIGNPDTPRAASDRVRAYTYEAVLALLRGKPAPAPEDERENRLQLLRSITNRAAEAAYAALVDPLPPGVRPERQRPDRARPT